MRHVRRLNILVLRHIVKHRGASCTVAGPVDKAVGPSPVYSCIDCARTSAAHVVHIPTCHFLGTNNMCSVTCQGFLRSKSSLIEKSDPCLVSSCTLVRLLSVCTSSKSPDSHSSCTSFSLR